MRVLYFRPKPNSIEELQETLTRHPTPNIREKASALLKIAGGKSATEVAQSGLLKKRNAQTVCTWVHLYESEGLKGLLVKKGQGVKPSFSPLSINHNTKPIFEWAKIRKCPSQTS